MRLYSALVFSGLLLTGLAISSQNFRHHSPEISLSDPGLLLLADNSTQSEVTPHRGSGR